MPGPVLAMDAGVGMVTENGWGVDKTPSQEAVKYQTSGRANKC